MKKKRNYKKYHSPKVKKKKKKINILKSKYFWFSLLGLVIFSGLFYLLSFSPWVQVGAINISGNEEVSKGEINQIIEEHINERIVFFDTRSIFIFSSKNTINNLLETFPKIESVSIKRKLFNTLNVVIKERGPSAIFCKNDFCLFVDQEGFAYKVANREDDYLLIINETGKELYLRENAISKENLDNIIKIDNTLKDLSFNCLEYIIRTDRLITRVEGDWEIYFYLGGDIGWQLTKLKTVLEKEIEDVSVLEYIELRFGNLSPYKVD